MGTSVSPWSGIMSKAMKLPKFIHNVRVGLVRLLMKRTRQSDKI